MSSDDSVDIGSTCFADAEDLSDAGEIKCPNCGISLLDLYKDGRMGCSVCYVTFKSTVHRALLVLHGAHAHIGKTLHHDQEQ